jgi:hypothetical protein
MKCNIFKTILFILIISILFIPLIGCNIFSPIIGKWQDNQEQEIVEFTSGGNVIIESKGYIVTGSYELIGDDIVKLTFDNLAGDFISAFGMDTFKYTISGDTMILQSGGTTSTYYRHGSTNTTAHTTTTTNNLTFSTNADSPFGVQNIYVEPSTLHEDSYRICVKLIPKANARLNTSYFVALYENGELRAGATYQYRYNAINLISTNVYFPCLEDEYLQFNQQTDLSSIFSVQIEQR